MTTRIGALIIGLFIAATPSTAWAQSVNSTITGGSLSVAGTSFTFANTELTGVTQTISANAGSAWSATDPRGTGAAWSVTVSATTPTSAGGDTETTPRTIAVGNLAFTTNTQTAGSGSDATTNLTGQTSLAMSTSAQSVLSCSGACKGKYTFTPTVAFTVPANAYRSNYATGTSGALNPYTSTITITIV
ncbi:MAG TPA: hypothetical protein VI916_04890 [Acidimicrobiia bacterium]|nr:hypothetical protein [Acidimicrobiia bacterium]